MTMAGGTLAETHANRRTDYAMVSDLPERPRQPARLPGVPRRDERDPRARSTASCGPGRYAVLIVRDAYQEGRYLFTAADLAARADRGRASCPRATSRGTRPGTRLRPYGYPRSFVPNIAHQHILVLRKAPEPPAARRGRPPAELRPRRTAGGSRCRRAARPRTRRPSGRCRAAVQLSAGRRRVDHDVAERHLVQPALAAVRAQDAPVGAALLEQDDLVALVEHADLRAADLVRVASSRLTSR